MYLVKTCKGNQTDLYIMSGQSEKDAMEVFNKTMADRFLSFDDVEILELTCDSKTIKHLNTYGDMSFFEIPASYPI